MFLCNGASDVFGDYTRKNLLQWCLNTPGTTLHRLKAQDNNAPEKILLNLGLMLLGQNCTGKNLLQRCLNTPWTTLHRLNKSLCNVVFEAPGNITQEKFFLYHCSLNTFGTTLHRSKSYAMLWESTDNIPQEKILCNVVLILLGQYCTGKTCNIVWEAPDNIVQEKILCNVFWTPPGHFVLVIFILDWLIFY